MGAAAPDLPRHLFSKAYFYYSVIVVQIEDVGQNPGGQNPGVQNPGVQNPGGQNPGTKVTK